MRKLEIKPFESASLAPPFFLLVIDYDTRRFALEGPVDEIVSWQGEVTRIRRSGRDVWFVPVELADVRQMTAKLMDIGCEEWPAHSIVDPPRKPAAKA